MYGYAHIRCIPDEDRCLVRRTGVNPVRPNGSVAAEYLSCRYCGGDITTRGNALLGPLSGPFCRRDVKHRVP